MKNFIKALCVLFLLAGCFGGTGPDVKDPGVDTQTSYFRPKHHNEIAIFPTYKYLGEKVVNIETSKVIRTFHVWKESNRNKFILITIMTPKSGTLPENFQWINKNGAIYSRGNVAAYSFLHPRVKDVIGELDGPLPDCYIIAQEFYFNEKEVMYKGLIVPDEMCMAVAEPVVLELNRVANMQP